LSRVPRHLLIVVAALVALALGGSTAFASGLDVIRDCTDDEVLTKTYAQDEYKQALSELAGDSDQYGNCLGVIKRAQLKALRDARAPRDGPASGGVQSPGGAATGTGGSFGNPPATKQLGAAKPEERSAVDAGRRATPRPVNLEGAAVKPGLGAGSDLPTPLLILLALVLAGGLALAAIRIRALVRARGA
jgi:hypothetical protein